MNITHSPLKKIVIVGDSYSGKSSMWTSYYKNRYQQDGYIPTVFDTHSGEEIIGGKEIQFLIFDTGGQEAYETLRFGTYPDTDVVLLCFAIDTPSSLKTIKDKWIIEVKKYCPRAAVILIGTKLDLRSDTMVLLQLSDERQSPVKASEGNKLARKIKALAYMECSAKTKQGLEDIFLAALSASLKVKAGSKSK